MDLLSTDVEQAALPTEGRLRIQLHGRGGQAVVLKALTDAACDIAEHFAVLDDAQRHAVFTQERAQASEVAEQVDDGCGAANPIPFAAELLEAGESPIVWAAAPPIHRTPRM